MTQRLNILSAANGGLGRTRRCADLLRRAAQGLVILIAAIFLFSTESIKAQEEAPMDYQVKAAFLVNFPKYIEWPDSTFPTTNSPITVAIFGDDNVANEFAGMIAEGKSVDGHPIVLKRVAREEEITPDCRMVFIGASEKQTSAAILQKLAGKEVLTVGESDDFLDKGGVINLKHQGRKIRLQVSLPAAEAQHLKISSRLFIVADVVKGARH